LQPRKGRTHQMSMNTREFNKLVASGETERVEFKEEANEHFYKTVSALANTKGGIILLGVDKNGRPRGVESSGKLLEDLTNRIVNKLSVYPEIETMDMEVKRVLAFKVARTAYPVSYEGRYYERVGNTTREMSPQKLRAFMLSSLPWDSITNDFSFDEIDTESVGHFIRLAVAKNRLTDVSLDDPPFMTLEKLELISGGKLTNGAVLLFGKNPQKHFINHCVRIGRFKTETIIIDDKWAKGNLFEQFEETLNVLKQYIAVRYEIIGIQREDIWDYPIPALREAVLNSLIHRDYFNIANFITIKVYDDHIWFSNPGRLPEGITIEELKRPHSSHLRNPLIAKAFYLTGYIEQYGSGTVRMVEWMKESGLPEPEYKEEMGGFSVYFHKDIYTEENLRKMELNERQVRAIIYVKEKGRITNSEYRNLAGVSDRTALRELLKMVEKGILEREKELGKDVGYRLSRQKPDKTATKPPQTRQGISAVSIFAGISIERLREMGLNERQIQAVMYVKEKGKITNQEFQRVLGVSKRTATNDLENLVQKDVLEKVGTRGKGTFYKMKKGATNGQIGQ